MYVFFRAKVCLFSNHFIQLLNSLKRFYGFDLNFYIIYFSEEFFKKRQQQRKQQRQPQEPQQPQQV